MLSDTEFCLIKICLYSPFNYILDPTSLKRTNSHNNFSSNKQYVGLFMRAQIKIQTNVYWLMLIIWQYNHYMIIYSLYDSPLVYIADLTIKYVSRQNI